jgi:hypothetical protein
MERSPTAAVWGRSRKHTQSSEQLREGKRKGRYDSHGPCPRHLRDRGQAHVDGRRSRSRWRTYEGLAARLCCGAIGGTA